jgi:type II secretory pathway pseudopilin PulG
MRGTSLRSPGFTLLEIVVAILIFFVIITFAAWVTSQSVDQALAAERARELRLLAGRKLAELAVFEKHYDEVLDGDFNDLPDGMREKFEGWTWKLDVTDRTVFGTQKDEHAEPLFDSATDTSLTSKTGSSSTAGEETAGASKGETQVLRELVLTVTAPGEDGGPGDSVEIVTYLPQVVAKQPQPAAGGGK